MRQSSNQDECPTEVTPSTTDVVFLTDKEWGVVEGEACRVKDFSSLANVADGQAFALGDAPYASILFECPQLPDEATGYITHRDDFLHLWSAFNERGVSDDEEVIVFWNTNYPSWWARRRAKFLPKLWVTICRKGAYELMTDPDFEPELAGRERFEVQKPVADWMPDAMV